MYRGSVVTDTDTDTDTDSTVTTDTYRKSIGAISTSE